MAAFAFNTSNVHQSAVASPQQGIAGQDILAGRPLYLNSAVSPPQLFYANSNVAPTNNNLAIGVAICSANIGQQVLYVGRDPNFSPGFVINAGQVAVVGNVAGQVNPVGDAVAPWGYLQILGVGIGGNNINLLMVGTNANF